MKYLLENPKEYNKLHAWRSKYAGTLHSFKSVHTQILARFVFFVQEAIFLKGKKDESNATVLNEHGYFGSPIRHYCRLCEALNYNSRCRFKYDEVIPHLEYEQGREIIQRLVSIVVEGLKLSQRFLKKRKTTTKRHN